MNSARRDERGAALLLAVAFVLIISILAGAFIAQLNMALTTANATVDTVACQQLAEAGINRAAAMLRSDPAFRGEANVSLGDGQFTVDVAPGATEGQFSVVSVASMPEDPRSRARIQATVEIEAGLPRIVAWKEFRR